MRYGEKRGEFERFLSSIITVSWIRILRQDNQTLKLLFAFLENGTPRLVLSEVFKTVFSIIL